MDGEPAREDPESAATGGGPAAEAAGGGRWRLAALWAAALAVWLLVAAPLALGQRTLFFRDVFSNHLLLKAFGAESLARGEIPALDPVVGLGQPFRGNPASLAFYPGNLLYLALPFWSAFNLHFALHWLLALLTMWVLARELDLGAAGALAAAVTYAGSGWMLSCLSFYNILTVAAWWPLAVAGGLRGGRRGIALGGLACGLALLGGEPVTAALGVVPLAFAAIARAGLGRGLARTLAIGAAGLAIALPQVVATLRITGFTFRSGHGLIPSQAVTYTLHPLRYLELAIPLPFGRPLDVGPTGFWAAGIAAQLPFYLSLYIGVVGLVLAAGAARRRPGWASLAAAGLLLAWLAGWSGELLIAATGGLFRFPEKFLFWFALAAPLLAGWGLEAAGARPRPRLVAAAAGGAAALALAAAIWLLRPAFLTYAASLGASQLAVDRGRLVDVQLGMWIAALAAAGALLLLAAWAISRRAAAALVALQLAALLQLWPLLRTDSTAPYRAPSPWAARMAPDAAVFASHLTFPAWHPDPRYRFESTSKATFARLLALDLGPVPGALHGLRYPLYPDIEGLSSPLYSFLLVNLPRLDWAERVRWMRAVGVDAAVLFTDPGVDGLRLLDRRDRAGVPTYLFAVEGGAPEVWWPERVAQAANPVAALTAVAGRDDPVAAVAVSRPVDHHPGGEVRLVAAGPDRVELAVSGPGGVVAVRRSYHHLWTARTGGEELPTLPLNLTLLGVEVPAGEHRVTIEVSSRPEAVAGGVALAALAACLVLAWPGRRP